MTRASRWVLAAAIAGSALAVGTAHTIALCVVTGVLLFTGIGLALRQKPRLPRRLSGTRPRQQAKSTSALYLAIAGSAVTSRRPSAIAWAMSIRSKGSL